MIPTAAILVLITVFLSIIQAAYKEKYYTKLDGFTDKRVLVGGQNTLVASSKTDCALECLRRDCVIFSYNYFTKNCTNYRSSCRVFSAVTETEIGNQFYGISSAVNNTQNDIISSNGSADNSVPVTENENDGWTRVFTIKGGSGVEPYWFYADGNSSMASDTSELYRSDSLNTGTWPASGFRLTKLEIVASTEIVYVIFNATDKGREIWFSPDNILESSYTDILDQKEFNDFYLNDPHGKRFSIFKGGSNSCLDSAGWMTTIHKPGVCYITSLSYPYPYIVYAKCNKYTAWESEKEFGIADYLNIYVK